MLEFLFCKFVGLELYKKQAPAQSFSSEYREIFESTYFEKHLRMVAFVHRSCFIHYHFPNSYRAINSYSAFVTTCAKSVDNNKFKKVCRLKLIEPYDREIDRNMK